MTTPTFAPTAEQENALRLFETGQSLAIEAGAGTGKTSTLLLLARSTQRRGQYVAFNKAIVVEASEKFPETVACSTAHSLAFRAVGRRYSKRLNGGRMKSTELAQRLGIRDGIRVSLPDGETKNLARTFLAGLVMRSVEKFCQSADAEISERHVPYIDGIDVPPGAYENNRIVARALVPYLRAAWADLSRLDGQLPFSHSIYLKLWQLSNPRIEADFILFDEAQDANPVMVAVVAAQARYGTQIVWVGDSQQQIYSFTGAVNALASVPADSRAFLTQSFRFGPAVAAIANRVLSELDAELRIVGFEQIESTVEPVEQPDAILCRTNAEAVRAVLSAQEAGISVHLVGGGKDVLAFARGARDLQTGGWTSHPDLACFASWGEVQEYVEQDEQGGDLRLLVRLVDEFGIPTIEQALGRMPREENADLVVSTAHKAKGREWNAVRIAADFPAEPQGEELRLLYVAVTRAKVTLDIDAVGFFSAPVVEQEEDDESSSVEPVAAVEPETNGRVRESDDPADPLVLARKREILRRIEAAEKRLAKAVLLGAR